VVGAGGDDQALGVANTPELSLYLCNQGRGEKATCEELKAKKAGPPSEKEKVAMEFMRNDDQAREIFVKKVAAPVMNKMFECGMIP